ARIARHLRHHRRDVPRRTDGNAACIGLERVNDHRGGDWTSKRRGITMPSTAQARFAYLLNLLGPFLGLLLVIGLFCIRSEVREVFLTGGNFKIILTQTVIVASCALGMTMIIISGGIDLSVGSVVRLPRVGGGKLLAPTA